MMIKPTLRYVGNKDLHKLFGELEKGEWFLYPGSGNVCSVMDVTYNGHGHIIELKYYDYCENNGYTLTDRKALGMAAVTIIKVKIEYTIAAEGDLK